MLEEVLADPRSDQGDIDAVLRLARRFGLETIEELALDWIERDLKRSLGRL